MIFFLIALFCIVIYSLIGRAFLPAFTKFQVQRIAYRYPNQKGALDSRDTKQVLIYSTWQVVLWPLAWAYIGAWRATGLLPNELSMTTPAQRRQSIIDQRISKLGPEGKTNDQLLTENKKMADMLGLPTDEYS